MPAPASRPCAPRPGAAVAAVVVAILLAAAALVGALPAAARSTADRSSTAPPTMTVVDVSPNTPAITSNKPRPLTFRVEVVNNSDEPLTMSISVARSDPIGSTAQLNTAIAHPKPPSPGLVSPLTARGSVSKLGAGQSTTVPIRTSTDTSPHDGVCLCQTEIYPFWFIGSYTEGGSSGQVTAQTYLPSFASAPTKSPVSWVWPLLDRPHRLLRPTVFLDDSLAGEIGRGGRLYRLLQVARRVSGSVPMTIVTDPDLIDELAVMSHGYRVDSAHGPVPGTGSAAASRWLATLRQVLSAHPLVQLVFTAFADPDVDSLTRAHMDWSFGPDPRTRARVTAALGGVVPSTQVAWPPGNSLSANTFNRLVKEGGANTVVVNDSMLTGGRADPVPNALAPLDTGAASATLAVTSAPIQRLTARILDPSANGLALLPELVSRLALRVMLGDSNYVVITPPRQLDVSVPVAVRTIEATADSTWSQPITVGDASGDQSIAHVGRGDLRTRVRGPRLGVGLLRTLRGVSNTLPLLTSMFNVSSVAARLVKPVPAAIQRTESAAMLEDRARSNAMADRLTKLVNHTRRNVYIVRPTDGTYTLTSKDSQLPITVVNRLGADINVKISIATAAGNAGLSAGDQDKIWPVKANSKVQVHIPLHVDRVGKIKLIARISTPGGLALGYGKRATPLFVRSTAIGTIGVVITILAAIALVLAVVYRQVRRIRTRGDKPKQEEPPVVVAATTASSVQ